MLIRCPHCSHRIMVKNATPRTYTPSCDKCKKGFGLLIEGAPGPDQRAGVFKTQEIMKEKILQAIAIRRSKRWQKNNQRPESPAGMVHQATDHIRTTPSERPESPLPSPIANSIPTSAASMDSLQTLASEDIHESVEDIDDISRDTGNTEREEDLPTITLTPELDPHQKKVASPTTSTMPDMDESTSDLKHPSKSPKKSSLDGDFEITLASDPDDAAAPDMDQTLPSGGTGGTGGTSGGASGGGVRREIESIDVPDDALHGTLGGFNIDRLRGRGGMGSVYLANQLSLDRPVAIKTINPQWAENPVFLSRFTREAYAAAQLVHHNVVQIYDMDESEGVHFFSMEYVQGQSLAHLIDKQGPMDVEQAAGYILQAARGLKFAHDHGMIHRDIKPDNLMLNEQGIVKVADLGLVKTPDSMEDDEAPQADTDRPQTPRHANITRANVAMGTPAYMAPEQARDARHVDARADIYSLGCTFYQMLTAKPVFEGETIEQLQTKHASEPVVPPQAIVDRVPQSLSAIILKMIAKQPSDRYANLDELIFSLEEFLGITRTGPFTPREEHANLLEQNVTRFNASKTAKLRHLVGLAFQVACGGLFLIFAAMKMPFLAGGVLGLWILSGISYFVITGITQKTFVFRKVRQYLFGLKLTDWLKWAAADLAILGLLWLFSLLTVWLVLCVVAVGWTAGLHFLLDRRVAQDRENPLNEVRELLKSMRLRGLDEDAVRRFVCKYSGPNWEPIYEELFGYEAKMTARKQWGGRRDDGKSNKKYAIWRDGLIAWINGREQQREQQKQREHLQKIEREKLKAQGLDDLQANSKAKQAAEKMVAGANAFRQATQQTSQTTEAQQTQPSSKTPTHPTPKTPPPVDLTKVIYGDEDDDGNRQITPPRASLMDKFLGPHLRLTVGVILIGLCVLWMYQNDLFPKPANEVLGQTQTVEVHPIKLPGVTLPPTIANMLSSYAIGVGGIFLIISSFLGGTRMTFYLLPGLAVLLGGQLVHIAPLTNLTSNVLQGFDPIQALGGILCLAGLFFGRSK